MTLNISLPPSLEALVQQKIAAGEYHSPDEVVHSALYMLDGFERLRDAKQASLRHAIGAGIEQAARGETLPADMVLKRLRQEAQRLAQQAPDAKA